MIHVLTYLFGRYEPQAYQQVKTNTQKFTVLTLDNKNQLLLRLSFRSLSVNSCKFKTQKCHTYHPVSHKIDVIFPFVIEQKEG